ncbi:PKD domain-containing protein [Pseudomonadota bacterium]
MQGLQRSVCIAVLIACGFTSAWAQEVRPDSFGFEEPVPANNVVIAERIEAQVSVFSSAGLSFRVREISAPGASFIKLHFSQFILPEGVEVEISNPDGSEIWLYAHNAPREMTVDVDTGDDGINRFSAMSITGDTVLVRITGDLDLFDPAVHRLEIDSWLEGFPLGESRTLNEGVGKGEFGDLSRPENSCGSDERYDSACWASSNPWEYERSAAVAKLITSRGEVCTAWRVGSDNHMFTAEHCLGKQSELDGSEIWFNYEASSCGGSSNTSAVKVTGGSLLSKSSSLDYSLFTVSDFSRISKFPAFGLETDTPPLGEPIFIPQHGLGQPRQIALESDMNVSGECEVDANDLDGYASGSDIGYYCDTATSSSGSPVVSNSSGRVVALHHFGGCLNSGVKISRIWPEVKNHFGGQVPNGNSGGSSGGSSTSGNDAPEADFSFDCNELSCSFDGSNSFDSDGEIIAFSWNLGNGDTESGASFAYEYVESGDYDVTLTVEDDEGETASATQPVTVAISNKEPQATFSATCVSNRCEFDATRSYDEDGEITRMDWTLGDGATARGFVVEHVYEEAGSYTVRLTATDDEGASDGRSKQVSVVLPNEAPNASFVFSCSDLDCSFDSSNSSDSDGEIEAWNWSFGDGSTADGAQISHSYPETGNFDVTLTVKDNRGKSDSSTQTVAASAANAPPRAAFNYSCAELECSFDASGSTDPDGEITAWNWNFGDGATGSGYQAVHSFPAEGAYTVSLEVSDKDGAWNVQTRNVQVSVTETQPEPEPEPEPVSNESPYAAFSYDCNELVCAFDSGGSYDSDGNISAYYWAFSDGDSGTGAVVSHRFEADGSYQVSLEVEDDEGARDTVTRTVRIKVQQSNSAPKANFSVECDELVCRFDAGSSQDTDGTITSYHWSMGDGASLGGKTIQYDYNAAGAYAVTLTVIDDKGESGLTSRRIEVEENLPEITLSGSGRQNNSRIMATLRWSGAETEKVDLYRDGVLIADTRNDGKLIDTTIDVHTKSAVYQLCQASSDHCSNTLVISFNTVSR